MKEIFLYEKFLFEKLSISSDKMQVGGFYAVEPKRDCPHIEELQIDEDVLGMSLEKAKSVYCEKCILCKETEENWICLSCFSLACSRYKNGHMKKHNEESAHPVTISLSDLSCWCYPCSSYIVSRKLKEIHSMLYLAKFNELPRKYDSQIADEIQIPKGNASPYPEPTPIHNDLPEDTNSPSALGHLKKEKIQEFRDEDDVLEAKIDELARMVKEANNIVTFTGAGISTSANIPDYRGPKGIWTLQDRGLTNKDGGFIRPDDAKPTIAHMALKALSECKDKDFFVVSTNVDGLHMKSGLEKDSLSELHGNIYKEVCCVCNREEIRDFSVYKQREKINVSKELTGKTYTPSRISHSTGRKCECGGIFCDSIINFGEDLPRNEIERSLEKARKANLSLVLGTSMGVAPANQLPSLALQNGGKLVIVNLQRTQFDAQCAIRIFAPTDLVFEKLFERLSLSIPEYTE